MFGHLIQLYKKLALETIHFLKVPYKCLTVCVRFLLLQRNYLGTKIKKVNSSRKGITKKFMIN